MRKIFPEDGGKGNPSVFGGRKKQAESVVCILIILMHYKISHVLTWMVSIKIMKIGIKWAFISLKTSGV